MRCSLFASTQLFTIEFRREDVLQFLRSFEQGATVLNNLNAVARAHCLETWDIMRLNNTFDRMMNHLQHQDFQKMLSQPRRFARHETIFNRGSKQEAAYIVATGLVNCFYKPEILDGEKSGNNAHAIHADDSENVDLGPGAFVGDVNCLKTNTLAWYTLTAKTDSTVYEVERIALTNFLNRYPGIKLQLLDRRWIN